MGTADTSTDVMGLAEPLSDADFAVVGRIAAQSGGGAFLEWLDHALDALRIGAQADASELFLFDEAAGELLLAGCTGPDAAAFCSQERFPLGRGYPGMVAMSHDVLFTHDLQRDPRYLRPQVQALGYCTFAAVPLMRSERLIGTLHAAWKRPDAASKSSLRLLSTAAQVMASALVAAQAELTGRLSEQPGETDVALRDQAERIRRFSGADEVSVMALDPGGKGVRGCGSTGTDHILCHRLAGAGSEECPLAIDTHRGIVLLGPRATWPAPCRRAHPHGFSTVIEAVLSRGAGAVGFVSAAWREPIAGPTTHLLAPLLSLGQSLVAPLRTVPVVQALPAVLPPVTATGTHRLHLQCFGPFTVYVDGILVHRRHFARAKAIDVLKILILHQGRPISRDALVERLWPDADLESGARSLHVAMHALRRAVEPEVEGRQWEHVLSRGDTFLIDLGPGCSMDLQAWKRLLAASQTAAAQGRSDAEVGSLLDQAIALYQGDLFEDDLDATWCLAEREAYRNQFLGALSRLSQISERCGAIERAVFLRQRAVRIDPLREDLQRGLIETLRRSDRLVEARRQYREYGELARIELGLRPSAAMRELGSHLGVGAPKSLR